MNDLMKAKKKDSLLVMRAGGNSMRPEINDGVLVLFKFDGDLKGS